MLNLVGSRYNRKCKKNRFSVEKEKKDESKFYRKKSAWFVTMLTFGNFYSDLMGHASDNCNLYGKKTSGKDWK
jgi:hypothetical protein